MSDVLDGFERVEKGQQPRGKPTLSIYANGNGYLNAVADQAIGAPDAVEMHTDPETNRIAFVPAAGEDSFTYQVSRDEESMGGDVHTNTALHDLGIEWEVEDTQFIELEREGDVLIADLSDYAGEIRSDVTQTTDEGDESVVTVTVEDEQAAEDADEEAEEDELSGKHEMVLEELERRDGSSRSTPLLSALRINRNDFYEVVSELEEEGFVERIDDPDDGRKTVVKFPEVTVGEADESSGIEGASEETIRDCAGSVDTVQELAGLFDGATEAQARRAARDAGVYDQLEDDRPRPMGMPENAGGDD